MDEKNSFLDKNTITAIALSILLFIGWQTYIQKNYPQKQEVSKKEAEGSKSFPQQNVEKTVAIGQNPIQSKESADSGNVEEALFEVQTPEARWVLSSRGMGFKTVELLSYSDRENKNIQFQTLDIPQFSTQVMGKLPHFQINQVSDTEFVGVASIEGVRVVKSIQLNPKLYTAKVEIRLEPDGPSAVKNLETVFSDKAVESKSSFLMPSHDGSEFFTIDNDSEERERIDIEKNHLQQYSKTSLVSVGSHYFALAYQDLSAILPTSSNSYDAQSRLAIVKVQHPVLDNNNLNITFTAFMGPKSYDLLKQLDGGFVQIINYGMFGVISKPLLIVLKWLYQQLGNWGFAIIFLTLFVRMLLLPINISSMRSMKKMQKIQPQLKSIKEKFKDDPMRMNQETMALMKREKANPLGGCLPMLMQLPIFFALYSVLGQSVELYKSPFLFWIHDLSYHDPFYVLPIAVGGLYYIQMSITPQPMDPAQAKVMKFIPLMFSFFMITVPSGLTLYFFVNTVFGIGQQLLFQRDKKASA